LFERLYSALDDPNRTKLPRVPAMMNLLAMNLVDEPLISGLCFEPY